MAGAAILWLESLSQNWSRYMVKVKGPAKHASELIKESFGVKDDGRLDGTMDIPLYM